MDLHLIVRQVTHTLEDGRPTSRGHQWYEGS
jgi:hypothetical protein